jgi:hypothetical protein
VQFLNRICIKFRIFAKFYINSNSLALLWMNLKAKLYILKKHTFLLLGPSSFEHWFKSYLCITVWSLSFLQIAFGSSFVYLSPPLLCFLCRAPPPLSWPCALPLPSLRCSGSSHVPPQPNATAPPSRAVFSSPCHAARLPARAAPRRCSPS